MSKITGRRNSPNQNDAKSKPLADMSLTFDTWPVPVHFSCSHFCVGTSHAQHNHADEFLPLGVAQDAWRGCACHGPAGRSCAQEICQGVDGRYGRDATEHRFKASRQNN